MRNPELMESSEDASSSPLAGGACLPRGITTVGFNFVPLCFFSLKIVDLEASSLLVDIFSTSFTHGSLRQMDFDS